MSDPSNIRLIASNTAVQAIGNILIRIIDLVIVIVLTGYLDLAQFGRFTFVITYLTFWGLIADGGAYAILVREASKQNDTDLLLGNAFSLGLVCSITAVLLANVGLAIAGYSTEVRELALMGSATLILSPRVTSFRKLLHVQFHANLKMGYVALWSVISYLLLIGMLWTVILANGSLNDIFIALIIAEALSFLGLAITHQRVFRFFGFRFDFRMWTTILRQAVPLMLSGIFATICTKLGTLLLEPMSGERAVGLYGVATRLPDGLPFVATTFMASVYPSLSRMVGTDSEAVDRIYRRSVRYLFLFVIPVAGFSTLMAKPILTLFFGSVFQSNALHLLDTAGSAFTLLIWTQVFGFAVIAFSLLQVTMGRERAQLACITLSAVVNISLNLLLIPILQIVGVAMATLVSTMVFLLSGLYFADLRKYVMVLVPSASKPFLATIIMGICVIPFQSHLLYAIPVGILSYGISIFLLKAIVKEDISLLKQLLPNEKMGSTP
jgi:O-antigen/teichoic acid export membrane protein